MTACEVITWPAMRESPDGDECHFTCVEFDGASDAPMESLEQALSNGTKGVP